MGLEKLIQAVAIFVVLTASTPAQVQLIQGSKASNWGMPYLLQSAK